MSEVCRDEKTSPAPTGRSPAPTSGSAGCRSVKDRVRATPGFEAQAALLAPVQRTPDPFSQGPLKSAAPKAGDAACRVRAEDKRSAGKGDARRPGPGPRSEPRQPVEGDDPTDPKACDVEAASTPRIETEDDRPPDERLAQLVADAAAQAKENMKSAVTQRLLGFLAAADYLAKSEQAVNEEKNGVLAFLETAFSIVSSALITAALAKMAAKGAVGVVKQLLTSALGKGAEAITGKIGEAAVGDKVSLADFSLQQAELITISERLVETHWEVAQVRQQLAESPYPHCEAEAAIEATRTIRDQAYRLQLSTMLASWANTVHDVKGGNAGVLEVNVAFLPSGAYSVEGSSLGALGEDFGRLLGKNHLGSGVGSAKTPFTLRELLQTPVGGMTVVIRDQSRSAFTWDPAQRAITTPDAHLMHHRVGAWGVKHVGAGVAPIVYAHRFLFEAIGAKPLAELGVGK